MRIFSGWLRFRRRDASPIELTITDKAKTVLLAALADRTEQSRVCISIHVNDRQFEVNFHYDVQVQDAPSKSEFHFLLINGVRVAVRRTDLHLLDGATLDYFESRDMGGFVWSNPNAPDDVLSFPGEEQPRR